MLPGSGELPGNKPKPAKPEVLIALSEMVSNGCYRTVDDPSSLPEPLQPYASGRFKSMVVASSDFVGPYEGAEPEYAPHGTVYLVRNYRYCQHDGSPHFNVDDRVFWTDQSGQPWTESSSDAPDHYKKVVAGTLVSDAWSQYRIPVASSGSLEEFRKQGAYLNFVKPCPGLWDKSRDEKCEFRGHP